MAQKPMLRAEVCAHAMRASQNRKKKGGAQKKKKKKKKEVRREKGV